MKYMFNSKKENLYIILFFIALTVILTWPAAWHFFSSVPSLGSDTMQVIGTAGERVNFLRDHGVFRGTFELAKQSEFNIITLYAYFFLIFGRIAGYNVLFFLSFILSGFGAYLLAYYFTKNKPASLIAGIIFAFSPFHVHNSLSTNVGTMHQEWLPFFALFLFKFFEKFEFKYFAAAAFFLLLIGFTEHQMLAFTLIFVFFFVAYKLIAEPAKFKNYKLWVYVFVSAAIFSVAFFFLFRNLLQIAASNNNFLDAGFKSAVKYSNDSLSIIVTPQFHSLWPEAFDKLRGQFERKSSSTFSVFAGYSVLLLSLVAVVFGRRARKNGQAAAGIYFWLAAALGFCVLSWGPYLHYKGILDPPVRMPYFLIYQYLPFYRNIRTVGRLFVYSMLAFSLLAAWGASFLQIYLQKKAQSSKLKAQNYGNKTIEDKSSELGWDLNTRSKILYSFVGLIVILEFIAIPFKINTLLHSSFYEKIGQDKENYSVLEVPGNTDYDFASRDLVWKSIHRKNTVNGYDFARVIEDHYTFQRGTPIIRTLLYDLPDGGNENDRDMMKNSYYNISGEILNYYNVRYVILDKEGLKGDPAKGDLNMFYPAKAYITNVIKCADEYEDEYLYACKINPADVPEHMFLAMDYSNKHWVGKSKSKNGLQRWAENGAGVKLVNMTGETQNSKLDFNLKVSKPLRIKVFLNGQEVYDKYVTQLGQKIDVSAGLPGIKPDENDVTFGVYGADEGEIRSDKKSDTAVIYQLEVE